MKTDELEELAEWSYRVGGLEPLRPTSTLLVVDRFLGRGTRRAVFEVERLAVPALVEGKHDPALLIRSGLDQRTSEWFAATAFARWLLTQQDELDGEGSVDFLAACLRAPCSAVERVGHRYVQVARAFDVSETSAVLRVGEVFQLPVAVIAPGKPIRLRGARRKGRWSRFRLHDAPDRFALLGAA